MENYIRKELVEVLEIAKKEDNIYIFIEKLRKRIADWESQITRERAQKADVLKKCIYYLGNGECPAALREEQELWQTIVSINRIFNDKPAEL
jgi:hypothetical protein